MSSDVFGASSSHRQAANGGDVVVLPEAGAYTDPEEKTPACQLWRRAWGRKVNQPRNTNCEVAILILYSEPSALRSTERHGCGLQLFLGQTHTR